MMQKIVEEMFDRIEVLRALKGYERTRAADDILAILETSGLCDLNDAEPGDPADLQQ